jgi:predicted Fe-Mo cluster-binding NifX family protein
MLVAIAAAKTGGLQAPMDKRFGRAPLFVVCHSETGEVRAEVLNGAVEAQHGAGPQAANLIKEHGAEAVIARSFGPKAAGALDGLGIKMLTVAEGLTVGEALDRLRDGGTAAFGSR